MPEESPAQSLSSISEDESYRYWAFISYSHRDAKWADWIHHELETYKVPKGLAGKKNGRGNPIPLRIFPVFRDRDELPGASDLSAHLRAVLEASRNLVVICSPASAKSRWVNEEIRIFKSLGRAGHIFCLIVDGEPNSDNPETECFPHAIRYALSEDGQTFLLDRPVEALAADARPEGDGKRNAELRLVAGLLGVGYDDLHQRDKRRRTRRKALLWGLGGVVAAGLVAGYILLADSGLNVPLGQRIRYALDDHELALFRPVHSMPEIEEAAARHRTILGKIMRGAFASSLWVNDNLGDPKPNPEPNSWAHAQSLYGASRPPETSREELRSLIPIFDVFFASKDHYRDGLGWLGFPGSASPQIEPALWMSAALTQMLGRKDLLTPEERQRFLGYLEKTHRNTRIYHQNDGGWNMYPLQKSPGQHNIYSATLALFALLETRSAGLPWDGSETKRDELIRLTADHLIRNYINDPADPGWDEGDTDNANPTIDGLTLQIFAELLRAELEVGIELPDYLLDDISPYLAKCVDRPIDFPVEKGAFSTLLVDPDGTTWREPKLETINFLWYPWAMEACTRWLQRAEVKGEPHAEKLAVQRALGHLVVDLGPIMTSEAKQRWAFVVAETIVGMSALNEPVKTVADGLSGQKTTESGGSNR